MTRRTTRNRDSLSSAASTSSTAAKTAKAVEVESNEHRTLLSSTLSESKEKDNSHRSNLGECPTMFASIGGESSPGGGKKRRTRPGYASGSAVSNSSPSIDRCKKKRQISRLGEGHNDGDNDDDNTELAVDAIGTMSPEGNKENSDRNSKNEFDGVTPTRSPVAANKSLPPSIVPSPRATPYWEVLAERGGEISPRLTRSATKKKREEEDRESMSFASRLRAAEDDSDDDGANNSGPSPTTVKGRIEEESVKGVNLANVALMFSPPNPKKNRVRERKERERKKQQHAERVENAKKNGQLLEFDKNGNPLTEISSPHMRLPPASSKLKVADVAIADVDYANRGEGESGEGGSSTLVKASTMKEDGKSGENAFCLNLSPGCGATAKKRSKSIWAKPDPESLFSPGGAAFRDLRALSSGQMPHSFPEPSAADRISLADKDTIMSQLKEFRSMVNSTALEVNALAASRQERDDDHSVISVDALERLMKESTDHAAKAARLEERNDRLAGEMKDLEGKLGEAELREQNFVKEIDQLKKHLDEKSAELRDLKDIIKCGAEATEVERAELEGRVADLKKNLEERTEALDNMKLAGDTIKNEMALIKKDLEKEKVRAADLADDLTSALSEKSSLSMLIKRSKSNGIYGDMNDNEKLRTELKTAQTDLQERTKAMADLHIEVATLKQELEQSQRKVCLLEREAADTRDEVGRAVALEGKKLDQRVNAAAEEAARVQRELKDKVREKEDEIEILKHELQNITNKVRKFEEGFGKERDIWEAKEADLLVEVKTLQAAIESAENARMKSKEIVGQLKREFTATEEDSKNAKEELANNVSAREAAEALVMNLTTTVQEEKRRCQEMETELTEKTESAQSEVHRLMELLASVKRERDGLRREKEAAEATGAQLQRENGELKRFGDETRRDRDAALERMGAFNAREMELLGNIAVLHEKRRLLHNRVMQLSGNIRVFVRIRPTISGEEPSSSQFSSSSRGGTKGRDTSGRSDFNLCPFTFPGVCDRDSASPSSAISSTSADDPAKNVLIVTEPFKDRGGLSNRQKKWNFGFDHVFSPSHNQDDVWEATEPLVQSCIDGFNVCVFAYGQTGSGKTFTMLGDDLNPGIVTRAVSMLFANKITVESGGESTVDISIELLEIYNENVRDLLAPNCGESGREMNLKINSNDAIGNVLVTASCESDVTQILALAQKRRCVKATMSNAESSRSHLIFTLHFNRKDAETGLVRNGKLHICDLAGSERLSKSGSMGTLLKETKCINTSLAVLSNVIEKLQAGDKHVPYRESKLTYLLKNSLGGDSKTLAIVCCNPLPAHFNESMCSLRFAAKVNRVQLKATGNFSC